MNVEEKLAVAMDLKNQAAVLFKKKEYEEARSKYIQALTYLKVCFYLHLLHCFTMFCVQYIGADLSNQMKAQVIELSVPIHNKSVRL
jgi:hypothetical protein